MALPSNWKKLHIQNSPTFIMGILNVTPDSFSDGGRYFNLESAVEHTLKMVADGADIIDIGGESTRPGADPVSLEEELNRVVPVIESIRSHSDICISIDSYKATVADRAVAAGADIINDISGLQFDHRMIEIACESDVPVVIMHMKGNPRNMQKNPFYKDLMQEMVAFFQERVKFCRRNGIKNENIILDPGIGFGKRVQDNYELLRELHQLKNLGFPILTGPSRKSFIGTTLSSSVENRFEGTVAAVTASILNGAKIVRVHDVKEMKQAVVIADEIRGIA
ncbi:MAG: dihydropteroate synthase [Fidelibacterota bacterium]